MYEQRVVSGMRPTGALHLGHFHGAIKNWVRLQSEYPCLFFVADWHALTTHYETPEVIEENVWDMVIDWLAAGIDPTTVIDLTAKEAVVVRRGRGSLAAIGLE